MVYTLRFFFYKCSLFHNSNIFGSCIIQILYTGCAKLEKNNSGAKRLILNMEHKIYSDNNFLAHEQFFAIETNFT